MGTIGIYGAIHMFHRTSKEKTRDRTRKLLTVNGSLLCMCLRSGKLNLTQTHDLSIYSMHVAPEHQTINQLRSGYPLNSLQFNLWKQQNDHGLTVKQVC